MLHDLEHTDKLLFPIQVCFVCKAVLLIGFFSFLFVLVLGYDGSLGSLFHC